MLFNNTLAKQVQAIFIGCILISSIGCRHIASMSNSMCPPGMMAGQGVVGQGVVGQGVVGQSISPNSFQPMQQTVPAQQPMVQPGAVSAGSYMEGDSCVTPGTAMPIGSAAASPQASESTLTALVEMVDKLQTARDENAQLRDELVQLKGDRGRHEKVAQKATQFADRLRTDNVRLKSDLTSWEERLKQLETLVESRQSHQADALADIDMQLDQLIAAYETDVDRI